MTKKIQYAPLNLIKEDPPLQARSPELIEGYKRGHVEKLLEDNVASYINVHEASSMLDPQLLFKEYEHYVVIDGHHRLEVYRTYFGLDEEPNDNDTSTNTIPVIVEKGDLKHHLSESYKVNTNHGVATTPGEHSQRLLLSCVNTPPHDWPNLKEMRSTTALSESQIDKVRKAPTRPVKRSDVTKWVMEMEQQNLA